MELNMMIEASATPINIVDVCCGDGSSLTKRLLKNKKVSIVGLDISRECAKSTPAFRANGFECIAADCDRGPIKNDVFNVAVIRNSLHHLTDLKILAEEMRRILRVHAALLIIEVETKSTISNFVYHRILSEPSYSFVSKQDVVSALVSSGFAIRNLDSMNVGTRRSFFVHAINEKGETHNPTDNYPPDLRS
jgi:ubiquinone/menaquinone biosynthesis C-methylase UbiE